MVHLSAAASAAAPGLIRYFECDTGLGMFIPQRYCRRSFLQRSRHDANANNGAFSRLRLDHRGVWLVEEMTNFEPPSSIQSLRELGVEPYVHVPVRSTGNNER